MERFCGHLKRSGASSKWFPYKSLNHYLFDWTTLWHLSTVYGVRNVLKLNRKRKVRENEDKLEILGHKFHNINLLSFIHKAVQAMDTPSWPVSRCIHLLIQTSPHSL